LTSSLRRSSPPSFPHLSRVARASLLIAVFFAFDKVLGLARQVVIGRLFGLGPELDAFNAANNLPDLLFALISGGALAIALIPVLSETLEQEGREAAWALFSRVANWAFLITAAFAVLVTVSADTLVRAELGVAPGFQPEFQDLVARLMRMNLIATLIFSLSGLVMAGLQANQHFLLPAMAPGLYNVGQIFGALVLSPEQGLRVGGITFPAAGLGVDGLVYGVILGAALHLGIQIPGLVRHGFRWSPRLDVGHPGLRKVARMMGPRILTIGTVQLIFVVQDNLASRLDIGSVTALAYGWLILQVPETIIGSAIGTALLPTLAEHFARADDQAFEAGAARAVRAMLTITVPAAALLMVGIRPLVQAAFAFDARGTELVVWAARAYLLGLVGHSLLEVAARAFYARQNARTPMLVAGLRALTFIGLSLLLFRPLGPTGIALSNSLAFTLEATVLLVLLSRRFRGLLRRALDGRFAGPLLRAALSAAGGGLATYAVLQLSPPGSLLAGMAALSAGMAVALPFLLPELRELARL